MIDQAFANATLLRKQMILVIHIVALYGQVVPFLLLLGVSYTPS
ncbi:hypothetical protein [Brevibacillus laterosporus]|nr:hypothetical protein [Brevibacillus laterosporus]